MKRATQLSLLTAILFSALTVCGQQNETSWPVVLEDDFQVDKRERYQIAETADWKEGELSLRERAMLRMVAPAYPIAELIVEFEFPPLDEDGRDSETRVAFEFEADRKATVVLTRRRDAGKMASAASFHFTDQTAAEETDEPTHTQSWERDLANGEWRFVFRHGYLTVAGPDDRSTGSYQEQFGTEPLQAVGLRQTKMSAKVRHLKLSAVTQTPLSEESQQMVDESLRLAQHGLEKLQAGQYQDAITAAEECLQLRGEAIGKTHASLIIALENLAHLHKSVGDLKALDDVYTRLMSLQQRALGEDHPSVASSATRIAIMYFNQGRFPEAAPLCQLALSINEAALGERHPETVGSILNLATAYLVLQHDDAEKLFLKALGLLEQRGGPDDLSIATTVNNLGELYQRQGDYEKAEPMRERALAIREQLLGKEDPMTIEALDALAALYGDLRQYERAASLGEEARARGQRVFGKDTPDFADLLNNAGELYRKQRDVERAEAFYEEAIAIYSKSLGVNHPRVAQCLNNLGGLYQADGMFEQAESAFTKAMEIRRQIWGENHPLTLQSVSNLSAFYELRSDYDNAERMLQLLLSARIATFGEDHPRTAVVLNRLGLALDLSGKFARAEAFHWRALAIRESKLGPKHTLTAQSLNNLAMLFRAQGKLAAARQLAERALRICEENFEADDHRTAEAHNILGIISRAQGQPEATEKHYRRALETRRAILEADDQHLATSLANLALLYQTQNRLQEAGPLYDEAMRIREKTLGVDHPTTAMTRVNLAAIAREQGDYMQARKLVEQALSDVSGTLGEDHPYVALVLFDLSLIADAESRFQESETHLQAAADLLEKARLDIADSGIERSARFGEVGVFDQLAGVLARNNKPLAAWRRWEQGLARGLGDELMKSTVTGQDRRNELQLVKRLQQLEKVLDGSLADLDDEKQRQLRAEQLDLQARAGQFRQQLRNKYGVATGEVYDVARVQAALPENAALVGWLDPQQWAVVVRKQGAPQWIRTPSAETNAFAQTSADLVAGLTEHRAADRVDARLQSLRATYWEPVAPALARRGDLPPVKHLIVLPSPRLRGIPLSLLCGEQYVVSYAPSATLFTWLQEKDRSPDPNGGPGELLAVCNPLFQPAPGSWNDNSRLQPLRELPGSEQEVLAIKDIFDRAKSAAEVLRRGDASEQAVVRMVKTEELKRFGYLHFATHGMADTERPMQSRIFLARNALPDPMRQIQNHQRVYRGEITAGQILRDWRLNSDLVVLSTCESALGQYVRGEGYVGFSQALLLAGSRSVLLSLWPVEDAATTLLMKRFYENLIGTRRELASPMPKAVALQEAQLWLRDLTARELEKELKGLPPIEEGSEIPLSQRGTELPITTPQRDPIRPFQHPYYWSGFILIGDAGDLTVAVANTPSETAAADQDNAPSKPIAWRIAAILVMFAIVGFVVFAARRCLIGRC